jgi:hypothetical protein
MPEMLKYISVTSSTDATCAAVFSTQGVDASRSESTTVPEHGKHSEDPSGAYWPGAHATHSVEPAVKVAAVPTAHFEHCVDPSADTVPSAHILHECKPDPLTTPKVPLGHAVHSPSSDW